LRALGIFTGDAAFIFGCIAYFGYFFRTGLLSLPNALEWIVLVFLFVFLWWRRKDPLVPQRIILRFISLFLIYMVFRTTVLLSITGGLALYRHYLAAGFVWLGLNVGMLLFSLRQKERKRWGIALLMAAVGLAIVLSSIHETGFRSEEAVFGLLLGIAIWLAFRWISLGRRRLLSYVLLSAAVLIGMAGLMGLDLVTAAVATMRTESLIQWVDRTEHGGYDMESFADGQDLYVAAGHLLRYCNAKSPPCAKHPRHIGAQRMAIDQASGRIFVPAFVRYEPDQDRWDDVYIYDWETNLVGSLDYRGCSGALYVYYNQPFRRVFYACEASNNIVIHDETTGSYQSLDGYLATNVMAFNETGDQTYVLPVLDRFIAVLDTKTGSLLKKKRVVFPVYGLVDDPRHNVIFTTRFILGDVIVRNPKTLQPMQTIRIDPGPRDVTVDKSRELLLTPNYFIGTLGVIDMNSRRVGRMFAGVRARGVFFDAKTDRLYFASSAGIGFYRGADLSQAYYSRGFWFDLLELGRLLAAQGVSRFFRYLLGFKALM